MFVVITGVCYFNRTVTKICLKKKYNQQKKTEAIAIAENDFLTKFSFGVLCIKTTVERANLSVGRTWAVGQIRRGGGTAAS